MWVHLGVKTCEVFLCFGALFPYSVWFFIIIYLFSLFYITGKLPQVFTLRISQLCGLLLATKAKPAWLQTCVLLFILGSAIGLQTTDLIPNWWLIYYSYMCISVGHDHNLDSMSKSLKKTKNNNKK